MSFHVRDVPWETGYSNYGQSIIQWQTGFPTYTESSSGTVGEKVRWKLVCKIYLHLCKKNRGKTNNIYSYIHRISPEGCVQSNNIDRLGVWTGCLGDRSGWEFSLYNLLGLLNLEPLEFISHSKDNFCNPPRTGPDPYYTLCNCLVSLIGTFCGACQYSLGLSEIISKRLGGLWSQETQGLGLCHFDFEGKPAAPQPSLGTPLWAFWLLIKLRGGWRF